MRPRPWLAFFASLLVGFAGACLGEDPDATAPDAAAADGSAGGNPSADGASITPNDATGGEGGPVGVPGTFKIATPEVPVIPEGNLATCFYFRTPNTDPVGVKHWRVTFSGAVREVTVYTTPTALMAAGTVAATDDCGFDRVGVRPTWIAAAQSSPTDIVMPADDGAGKPVAYEIPAGTAGFMVLHLLNPAATPATARAALEAEYLLPPAVDYTRTASYVAYDTNLNIPAATTGATTTQSCPVPAGAKFWWLSTSARRRATKVTISDGPTVVSTTTDWEHPEVELFPAPFRTFTGAFIPVCTYTNDAPQPVRAGNSVTNDEQCIGIGLFFPTPVARTCLLGTLY